MPRSPQAPAHSPPRNLGNRTFGKSTLRLVRRKAWRLARCRGFSLADREDIEQELLVKVWEASGKFDPELSRPEAFIATVVERAATTLARAQKAVKRGHHLARHPFGAMHIDVDEGKSPTGAVQRDPAATPSREADLDLASDLAQVLAGLPDELREVASRLGDGSKRAVARTLGISRRALEQRIAALRAHLLAAGLGEFSE
jgi:RNA polymerase sigma factor (sigma-70 family)